MLVDFHGPHEQRFVVTEDVLVNSELHHLGNRTDRRFLQLGWPANLDKLRAAVPSSRNHSDFEFPAFFLRVVQSADEILIGFLGSG